MRLALLLLVMLFPIHTRCGASSSACALPPDASGRIGYYYENEPFGISLIEGAVQQNFRITYNSGTERVEPNE